MQQAIYRGNHREFIRELFSTEFIEASKKIIQLFIVQFLEKVAIEKKDTHYVYPTNLFERLSYACGDHNPELDYELYRILDGLNLSSQKILSILVTDITSSNEQLLNHYFDAFSQQSEDVQGAMIEDYFVNQHDSLPYYLRKKLSAMIYNFGSEFDLSDGRIDIETYNEKLECYKDLAS